MTGRESDHKIGRSGIVDFEKDLRSKSIRNEIKSERATRRESNVRISPTCRAADPAIETLGAGAHAQPRPGGRFGAGHSEPRDYQGTILATRHQSWVWSISD